MRPCTCGNAIDDDAYQCPKCGKRYTTRATKLIIWLAVATAAVGGIKWSYWTNVQKQLAKDAAYIKASEDSWREHERIGHEGKVKLREMQDLNRKLRDEYRMLQAERETRR